MNAAEIEKEIRLISERIKIINNDMPEMSGMDYANEQGWITQEEWDVAEVKSKTGMKLQEAEVEKIEARRFQCRRRIGDFHRHAKADVKTREQLWREN